MPLCGKCGKHLACECGAPKPLGSPEQSCPLKQGAVWVHVIDTDARDIEGVTARRDGIGKDSDKNGISAFDPLAPGTYKIDLGTLTDELKKVYEEPDPASSLEQQVRVAAGEITYVAYELKRKPLLKVKVAEKGNAAKFFSGAKVSISGPENKPDATTTEAEGICDFGAVKSGKYELKASLKAEDDKDWATSIDFTKTTAEQALAPGEQKTVTIEVDKKNVVKPKIELEYKLVLLDRKLSDHQAGEKDEDKIFADATRVEISLEQSNKDAHPFDKGGTLKCDGAGKVEIFADEKCSKKSDGKLTKEQLTGDKKLELWLRGTTAGKFEVSLELEDPADRFIKLSDEPHKEEMAVVEVPMKLHQFDESKMANEEFDADKDTLDAYFTALKDKVIPAQEEMSDEAQVKSGRMLHVQKDGNHGRAKLILTKLTGDWLADADEYDVVLSQKCKTGALQLYDKETEGDLKAMPHKVKVKDLKAADVELWVEGKEATKAWRDIVFDIGLDRSEGGLAKKEKHNGNWARFTVVQVKEIKLDYTPEAGKAAAWNAGQGRFYINLKPDPDGRKIKLAVELTEKLENVPIHFMLAPHKDNGKEANWGADLPATWKWKDIPEGLKHGDRSGPKKLLHLNKKTDANGKADLEVKLSRFGGDVFEPGAYVTQDPHLAKYVREHDQLKARKPVVADKTITVWRKLWYQMTKAQGFNPPQPGAAESAYEAVKTEMVLDQMKEFTQATAPAQTFYPEYMMHEDGGSSDTLVANIGDYNKRTIATLLDVKADQPVKRHLLVCTYQYDSTDRGVQQQVTRQSNPIRSDLQCGQWINLGKGMKSPLIVDPILQGGSMIHSLYWYRSSAPGTQHAIPPTDARIPKPRDGGSHIQVKLPPIVPPPTQADPVFVVAICNRPDGPYLGESFDVRHTLIVLDPTDITDYNDTVVHEIGHSFNQTPRPGTQPGAAQIPNHPNQADCGQGNHCRENNGPGPNHAGRPATSCQARGREYQYKCVMYDAGPMTWGLHKYCKVCQPYVLVEDLHRP